jgi:hypothetical protein
MRHPLVLAIVAVAVMAPACGSDDVPAVADLGSVVPTAEQAPPGLRYADRLSGPADLEAFRGDPEGRDAMRRAGFRSAWTALFADPRLLEFFTLSRPDAEPPEDAELLTTTVVLCADAAGATEALRFLEDEAVSELRGGQSEGTESAFQVHGTRDGAPASALGATADEIVVLVQTQGEIPSDAVTDVFDRTLERARAEVG